MRADTIYNKNQHTWFYFGRDPETAARVIDTNQYMIRHGRRTLLMDPGGIELFPAMLSAVLHHAQIEHITDLFASHQDPDIISSLGYWDKAVPHARLHAPWLWKGFIKHFQCDNIEYVSIPDEGGTLNLDGLELQFVPAHYVHSSGNFNVYDPAAKILMSGDIGAALEPIEAGIFVEDFDAHVEHMAFFHQRWMPSNEAKNNWVKHVRTLDIDMMAPQHGRIFKGDDVQRFLDWFEALEVGNATHVNLGQKQPSKNAA